MPRRSLEPDLEPDLASTWVETDLASTEVATAASTEVEPEAADRTSFSVFFSNNLLRLETQRILFLHWLKLSAKEPIRGGDFLKKVNEKAHRQVGDISLQNITGNNDGDSPSTTLREINVVEGDHLT